MLSRFREFKGKPVSAEFVYMTAYRGLVIVAGLGMTLIIPRTLSGLEQGYFFTFLSLSALQAMFELGLSSLLVQFFSHEFALLRESPDGLKLDGRYGSPRICDIATAARRYFNRASLYFTFLVGGGGLIFFYYSSHGSQPSDWLVPWVLTVIAVSIALRTVSRFAIIDGFGHIECSARIRVFSLLISTSLFFLLLYLNFGLYAYPLAIILGNLFAQFKSDEKVRQFKIEIGQSKRSGFDWAGEVSTHQRRIGISFLSGYVASSTIVPYAFYFFDPVMAGKIGMSLAIFSAISAISSVFNSIAAPRYGMLVATRQFHDLLRLWKSTAARTLLVMLCFCLMAVACYYFVFGFLFDVQNRLVGPATFLVLCALAMVNTGLSVVSTLLRSFKEELLMEISLAAAAFAVILQLLVNVQPANYFSFQLAFNLLLFLPVSIYYVRKKLVSIMGPV